jgi:hypothetical protein
VPVLEYQAADQRAALERGSPLPTVIQLARAVLQEALMRKCVGKAGTNTGQLPMEIDAQALGERPVIDVAPMPAA